MVASARTGSVINVPCELWKIAWRCGAESLPSTGVPAVAHALRPTRKIRPRICTSLYAIGWCRYSALRDGFSLLLGRDVPPEHEVRIAPNLPRRDAPEKRVDRLDHRCAHVARTRDVEGMRLPEAAEVAADDHARRV